MSERLERRWYVEEPRILAALAGGAFGAAVRARNALFDRGVWSAHRVDGLRVISVGNINVGGAGKTPIVIHLAQRALARGKRVAVLTRGYGRASRAPLSIDASSEMSARIAGDEPLLIARSVPGIRVFIDADRVRAARRARAEGFELALLDDGFQHRRLARDVDIVAIDEAAGFGNGALLPAGPLREPLRSLERASLLWLRESQTPRALSLPALPRVRARFSPRELIAPGGERLPPNALRGQQVVALCGIARPSAFIATLRALEANVTSTLFASDHAAFSKARLDELSAAALSGAWLVTTEKDRLRLPLDFPGYVIAMGLEILEGDAFVDRVLASCA